MKPIQMLKLTGIMLVGTALLNQSAQADDVVATPASTPTHNPGSSSSVACGHRRR